MGRFVNLAIPTAPEGAGNNYVNISGVSFGLKKDIRPNIAILPEVGAYWYDGQIAGITKKRPRVSIRPHGSHQLLRQLVEI